MVCPFGSRSAAWDTESERVPSLTVRPPLLSEVAGATVGSWAAVVATSGPPRRAIAATNPASAIAPFRCMITRLAFS
jgi:hypothetical protein